MAEQQLGYWRHQLGIAALELPTDRPRPAVQSFAGDRVEVRLADEVSAGVRLVCQRYGVTLFMTLLSAFQMLLARYTSTPYSGGFRDGQPFP